MGESSQLESLDFACGCLGKLRKKLHPMWTFVDGQSGQDELLQFSSQFGATVCAVSEHDTCCGFGKLVGVLTKDDCDLQYKGMLAEHAFDLDRAYPDPADLDHVVGSAGIPEISVFILMVFVAGAEPVAGDRGLRLFVLCD